MPGTEEKVRRPGEFARAPKATYTGTSKRRAEKKEKGRNLVTSLLDEDLSRRQDKNTKKYSTIQLIFEIYFTRNLFATGKIVSLTGNDSPVSMLYTAGLKNFSWLRIKSLFMCS